MNKPRTIHLLKSVLCAAALLLTASTQVQANTFAYTNGDVLICFRKATTGATNLIVDAGSISYFTNLTANQTVTIGNYTGAQLGQVGTNSIAWSAWTYFDNTAPSNLRSTIYMSKPRSTLNTQTTPYFRDKSSAQGQVISVLGSIVAGAAQEADASYSPLSTSLAILEDSSYNNNNDAVSYYIGLGSTLDFQANFQSQPDQYTPANFITSGTPVRADFYWLSPTNYSGYVPAANRPGAFIGYFQLSTNGVMTYTAYPSPTVDTPVILSFTRTGNQTNTVTFTTGSIGTYTLRGTNIAGLSSAARTNWPAISSVSGNGSPQSLFDVTTDGGKFYTITAQ
jgi:hypothetical protein